MPLVYGIEPGLSVEEFVDLLIRSTLAERRPVDEPDRVRRMLERADIVVTARLDGQLIGVARSLSDGAFVTYLSDLAVDVNQQRSGIGRELVRRTREAAGPDCSLVLLAAPAARGYYPKIGMEHDNSCWMFPRSR